MCNKSRFPHSSHLARSTEHSRYNVKGIMFVLQFIFSHKSLICCLKLIPTLKLLEGCILGALMEGLGS